MYDTAWFVFDAMADAAKDEHPFCEGSGATFIDFGEDAGELGRGGEAWQAGESGSEAQAGHGACSAMDSRKRGIYFSYTWGRFMLRAAGQFVALFIAAIFVVSSNAYGEEPSVLDDVLLGWSITPGIGVRVLSLYVKRNSDGHTGELTNDGSFTEPIFFSFDVESPTWMLSPSIGMSARSHSQTFKLSRQRIPSKTTEDKYDYEDFGTGVRGYYSYLGPILFYVKPEHGGDSRYGLGVGYWKAWFDGDIILAPDLSATKGMPTTKINGSIDGNLGFSVFWQSRGPKTVLEMAINRTSFSQPKLQYTMIELLMSVGYRFQF